MSRETESPADAQDIGGMEALRQRAVEESRLLAVTEDGGGICLFKFVRQGDDMLFR